MVDSNNGQWVVKQRSFVMAQEAIRIESIKLQDYRGRTVDFTLGGKSVMLTGPNGIGKSSILRAISLALTGRLPGSVKELDTDGYLEDTGPSGSFKIEVSDTDRGRIIREFTGTQMRVRANFGDNPTSARNSDHEAAIVERCGKQIGLFMSAERILALPPDSLRNMVLRMCAESSPDTQWNADMICEWLVKKVPGLKNSELMIEVNAKTNGPGMTFDPLRFMDALQSAFEGQATECRRLVRELNQILNATAPFEMPNPETVEEKKKALAILETKLSDIQRAIGRLEERKKAIEAANADSTQKYQYSTRYIKSAEEAVKTAEAAVKRYESGVATSERELAELKLYIPIRLVPESNSSEGDLFSEGGNDSIAVPVYGGNLSEDKTQLNELADRIEATHQDVRAKGTQVERLDWQIAELKKRKEKYESGKCPECGQDVSSLTSNIDTDIDSINNERIEANDAALAALALYNSYFETNNGLLEKIQTFEGAQRDAQEVLKRQEQEEQDALRRHNASIAAKQQELDSLRLNLTRYQVMLDEAKQTYEKATTTRLDAIAPVAPIPAELTDELDKLQSEDGSLHEVIQASREELEAINGQISALTEFNRKQFEATGEKQQVQNELAILTTAISLMPELLNAIVDALVGPLVVKVNETLPARLGSFVVKFNPSFSIGIERVNGDSVYFLPMSALSTAERCIFLSCVQKAFIDLAGTPMPVILIDNVEVMDEANWKVFTAFVQQSEATMQIIVAGRRAEDTPALSMTAI